MVYRKNYSWLKNVSINHGKIDLTKNNKKKNIVIEKINDLKKYTLHNTEHS